ncbi:MAG: phosphate signaling complex protein PhoU [Caulobacteraceae bacterium]|nr:phosphate signaling complex protein PhoU [Caulobacter sp.]
MNEHTLKFFGEELNQLKAEVARMGGLAEAQVADAVEAVANRDVPLAQLLIGRDMKLDAMQADIEKKAIRMIALRQPVAQDLRRTVAALKMAWSLERTGDLAKNIAKRALVISEAEPIMPLTRSIERMGKLVVGRLKSAIDAYTTEDLDGALDVWNADEDVDEQYNSLFRELLTYMMSDPRMISSCAHLLFIGKNLERIGDHATNVAEILHYEVTGEEITGERPKQQDVDVREAAAPAAEA